MADFGGRWAEPQRGTLSVLSDHCLVGQMARCCNGGFTITATSWPANNRAYYIPIEVPRTIIVTAMSVVVSTSSGNLDVGIYDIGGNRLVSAGSTAMAVAGVQTFDITDTTLYRGTYYLAVNVSTTAAALRGMTAITATNLRMCGMQQQDVGATALPNPAAFVAGGAASAYCPLLVATYQAATF